MDICGQKLTVKRTTNDQEDPRYGASRLRNERAQLAEHHPQLAENSRMRSGQGKKAQPPRIPAHGDACSASPAESPTAWLARSPVTVSCRRAQAQDGTPQRGGVLRVSMNIKEISDPATIDWSEKGNTPASRARAAGAHFQ